MRWKSQLTNVKQTTAEEYIMSILNNFVRPSIEFDVNNVEHRQHYLTFIQSNSWSKCPVRFKVDPQYTDVVSMINAKISEFYLSNDAKVA